MYASTKSNNFDLLRLLLATTVFIVHSGTLSQINEIIHLGRFLNAELAVDGFFVVSGFLIFMSYDNSSSIKQYFIKRARRIYPAYVTVVLVCAIVLPLLLAKEFPDNFISQWFKYVIANALFMNFLQSSLPGVFEQNYLPAINGALWTIKVEVMFYLSVPIIIYLMNKSHRLFLIIAIYITALAYSMTMSYLAKALNNDIFLFLEVQLPTQLAFFISGAFLYYFHQHFKNHLLFYLMFAIAGFIFYRYYDFYPLYPASLAILIIYFATIFQFLGNWGKHGDFSYGIYIWHFPIIQAFVSLKLLGNSLNAGYIFLVLTLLAAAFLSWHLIEKPFLRKKSHYREAEQH